jgi:histidinol-phosphate aminotransferase
LIADAKFVDMLQRVRQPFNVNRLVQRAACVAIQQRQRVAERREINRRRLARVAAGLSELGLSVLPSQTNFLLATRPGAPASFFQELLREGVIVRPMASFGLPAGSFRVNVGTEEENEFFLAALRRVLLAVDRV